MESSTFDDEEELSILTTNIMIYTGDGNININPGDLNSELLDNTHYYIVNGSEDVIRFARCGECFTELIVEPGHFMILLKADGDFFRLSHPIQF